MKFCPKVDSMKTTFYLPRHMARESVSGSLEGWTEPVAEQQSQSIDNILGYQMEQMDTSSKMDGIIGSADGDEMMAYDTMMTAETHVRALRALVPTHESSPAHELVPVFR